MVSSGQKNKLAKYRRFAKKNVFCKYLVMAAVIINVIVRKFFSFHRRKLIAAGQVCLVTLVFLLNTSFSPPSFAYASANVPIEKDADLINELSYSEEELLEQIQDEHEVIEDEETANLDDLIEKRKDTVIESTDVSNPEGSPEGTEEENSVFGNEVVFDKNDWKLLLVNKQHTIPEDYEFILGTIKGSMRCDERIIEPLTKMFAAARKDGINLVVRSPYRDMARQEYLFERKVKNFQKMDMSYLDAYKKASVTVTVPGASEHQIGLAVDITSDTYPMLEVGFSETEAGKWLAEHSCEYGFILRYPLGKEEITGIQFEPWHFRYVGVDAAKVITSQNITLEEFVENL